MNVGTARCVVHHLWTSGRVARGCGSRIRFLARGGGGGGERIELLLREHPRDRDRRGIGQLEHAHVCRIEWRGRVERLAELDAHRNGIDVRRGARPRWDGVVREREQRDVRARVQCHEGGVIGLPQAAAPVAVFVRRRIHDVTPRLQVREVELAARVGHGQVPDAVRERHRFDQRAQ